MPRRREVPKRIVVPDPKYGDQEISKFVNCLMSDGKKSTAERILYGALEIIKSKNEEEEVLTIFKDALRNVEPRVEVKSRRIGGSTYQVPVDIRSSRRQALARRWLISFARSRSEKTMIERLAGEIAEAAQNRGGAIRKKEDTHRMADANKAFAHYSW
jgi:small subunit ribosomal protein S7